MASYYEWIKAFHIIAVISWMAGMLYLPRIFVYHTKVPIGSEQDKIFQIMERKLFKFIMTPAMIVTIILGLMLCDIYGWHNLTMWFHIKASSILCLVILHGLFSRWRKNFILGKNLYSEKFYRYINEIPTMAMIIAVIMVIVKPFD